MADQLPEAHSSIAGAARAEASRHYRGLGRIYYRPGTGLIVESIYGEVFRQDNYLQHGISLAPGDTVFDVGANIGLFSLRAAKACRNDIRLFAFEPIPETFRFLRKNLAEYGLAGRADVHLINAGLGPPEGPSSLSFTFFGNAPPLATTRPDYLTHDLPVVRRRLFEPRYLFRELRQRGGRLYPLYWVAAAVAYPVVAPFCRRIFRRLGAAPEQVTCAMTSFSAVVRQHAVERIDLLKIDVEGVELDILRSIEAGDWPKVRQVAVEVHDIDGRLDAAKAVLAGAGFDRITSTRPRLIDLFQHSTRMIYAKRSA